MSVARRANLMFAVIFVMALAVAGTVFGLARGTSDQLADYRTRTDALQGAMWSVRSDFYNFDAQMNMYVAVMMGGKRQNELSETTYKEASAARARMGFHLDHADRLATDPGVRALLSRLRKDYVAYGGFADQARSAAQAGDLARALHLVTVGNLEPSNDMMPTLDKATALVQKVVTAQMNELQDRQRTAQIVAASFGGFVVLVLLMLMLGLRAYVLRPVAALRDKMSEIATGRAARAERVKSKHNDEFGQVATAFNTMLDALAEQDAELAEEHAAREAEIQANADRTRAAEQGVRDRAQTVIDENTTAVAAELHQVMSEVNAVRDSASVIDERVSAANQRTREVVEHAQEADRVVTALGESLRRVGDMAKLIASVADQTKLLALNATIEAARAGESGKGFNVVASEVKGLAVATAQSTSDITNTISTLEGDAAAMTGAITRMANGISGVDEATAVLSNVAAQQHTMVQSLEKCVVTANARVESMANLTERLERRKHPRTPMRARVLLSGRGGGRQAELVDLSEGGLRCSLTEANHLIEGETVSAELELNEDRFTLRGRVLRREEHHGTDDVALQFVDLSASDLARLRSHLPFN